jgi:hypothetical protein
MNDPNNNNFEQIARLQAALADVPQPPVTIELSGNKLTVTVTAAADPNIRWSFSVASGLVTDSTTTVALVYPEGGNVLDAAEDNGTDGNTGALKTMLIKTIHATADGDDGVMTVQVVQHDLTNGTDTRTWDIPVYVKLTAQ